MIPMKYLFSILFCLGITTTAMAQEFEYEVDRELAKEKIVMKDMGGGLFIAQSELESNKRYMITNLPEEYRVDGLRLVCWGMLGKIPPAARLAGTPMYVTKIKAIKGYKELGVMTRKQTFPDLK